MALLTPGYWPDTYWAEAYWIDDYWCDYGTAVAPVTIVKRKVGHDEELMLLYQHYVLTHSYEYELRDLP